MDESFLLELTTDEVINKDTVLYLTKNNLGGKLWQA